MHDSISLSKEVIFVYLYLVQHGEAKKEEEDPARGLTNKGRNDVSNVAASLQKMNTQVKLILHSGKTRAVQTAQIFAGFLKPAREMTETDGLAPMDDPRLWVERVAEMDEDTMLVGHLPSLARLAGILLCAGQETNCIDFQMGGVVCCKRFDDGRWAVEWMIVPAMVSQPVP